MIQPWPWTHNTPISDVPLDVADRVSVETAGSSQDTSTFDPLEQDAFGFQSKWIQTFGNDSFEQWIPEQVHQQSDAVTLMSLQAEIDGMVTTSQERYKNTCRPEDRYSNGISEMLGLNVSAAISKATRANGRLFARIMQWFRAQPGCEYFPVTSVQVNKNLLCHPHRDRANEGDSFIIVFGQFRGGGVFLWRGDDTFKPVQVVVGQQEPERHDAKIPLRFDGRLVHGTEPFIGVRYSIVFFVVRGAANATRPVQAELVHDGALCDAWQVQAA